MHFTNMVDAYKFIDTNFDQTNLVNHLLEEGVFDNDSIEGNDEENDIYHWFVFTRFIDEDYEKLAEAGIPVLKTDFQNWVWVTTLNVAFEDQFYPELIKVLYWVDATPKELAQAKKEI